MGRIAEVGRAMRRKEDARLLTGRGRFAADLRLPGMLQAAVLRSQGQLLTTTFMDYLLPTAQEMPASTVVRILEETPTPLNPLGAKGAGEGGSSGCGAAVATAVADALAPLGVSITALPLPPDRLLTLVQAARQEGR